MPDPSGMQPMKFTQPWNGHVPGEVAGFTPETCRKLFDAEVARYVDHDAERGRYVDSKLNVTGLGATMLHKMKAVVDAAFGVDNEGAPVPIPNPQGFGPVTAQQIFSNPPGTNPTPQQVADERPEVGTELVAPERRRQPAGQRPPRGADRRQEEEREVGPLPVYDGGSDRMIRDEGVQKKTPNGDHTPHHPDPAGEHPVGHGRAGAGPPAPGGGGGRGGGARRPPR